MGVKGSSFRQIKIGEFLCKVVCAAICTVRKYPVKISVGDDGC